MQSCFDLYHDLYRLSRERKLLKIDQTNNQVNIEELFGKRSEKKIINYKRC